MRYLRKQVLNRRAPFDQRLSVDINNAVVMNTSNNVTLPVGTTAQRPVSPVNGMMRYNTSLSTAGELEVYQSNTWRSLRFKESGTITQQNLGAGDNAEVYFGPLNPVPPAIVQSGTTWGGQNILVIVENVIQLNTTNYTVVQNPTIGAEVFTGAFSAAASTGATLLYLNSGLNCTGASGTGSVVRLTFTTRLATPFAVGSSIIVSGFTPTGYNGTYTVTACTTTYVEYTNATSATMTVAGKAVSSVAIYPSANFTGSTINGSASFQASTTISSFTTDADTDAIISVTINKTLSGNITANTSTTITESISVGSGYYLKFSSPVPYGKIVTALIGFDQ